jgi:putative toxin-antitoxin system antitoxin component (TIGR02293 family)
MSTLALVGKRTDVTRTIRRIRRGVSADVFAKLADALALSRQDVANRLGLVARTLDRQRKAGVPLSPEASEKVLRLERILELTRRIVPDDRAAARWLLTPAGPLDNTAPIDLLDTDVGAREVEAYILGIGYGHYQ